MEVIFCVPWGVETTILYSTQGASFEVYEKRASALSFSGAKEPYGLIFACHRLRVSLFVCVLPLFNLFTYWKNLVLPELFYLNSLSLNT